MGSKTFLGSLLKVLIHCDFLNSGCLRTYYDFTANVSHGVSIFRIECKLNDGTCQLYF